MKKILSFVLSFSLSFLSIVSLAVGPARTQDQIASVGKTIKGLKEELKKLRSVELAPDTPPEIREKHNEFLEQRRAELRHAVHTRLSAFRSYRAALTGTLETREGQEIDKTIRQLEEDLRAVEADAGNERPTPGSEPAKAPVTTHARLTNAALTENVPAVATAGDIVQPKLNVSADPAGGGARPATAIQAFPGAVTITSPQVAGMPNVYETKTVTLNITFNGATPVDEIEIGVQKGGHNVQGYPKNVTISPSKFINGINEQITMAEGINTVTVRVVSPPPLGVAMLMATFVNPAPPAPAPAATGLAAREAVGGTAEVAPEYDWGRARGYFAGGAILSKERDDFSKTDIFLDFTLDKNYFTFKKGPIKDINTFFNARLTSIPVAQPSPSASPSASPTPAPSPAASPTPPCNTPECQNFISSRKGAMMQAGFYAPIYGKHFSWIIEKPLPSVFEVTRNADGTENRREKKRYSVEKNALFIAPLAKGGIQTITGDRRTAEADRFGRDDIFNFFSLGAMFGHFRLPTMSDECTADEKGKADGTKRTRQELELIAEVLRTAYEECGRYGVKNISRNRDYSPELISWLTISAGRFESFEVNVPTEERNAAGEEITVRRRPWRWEALGRLKIPETNFIVGFDGNFGKGPDDLRFIFATRFDIGKVLSALKIGQQQRAAP